METIKEYLFDVTCYIHGIKKKCRRNAIHSIKLGRVDSNELTNDIKAMALSKIKETMKSHGSVAKLCFTAIEIEEIIL